MRPKIIAERCRDFGCEGYAEGPPIVCRYAFVREGLEGRNGDESPSCCPFLVEAAMLDDEVRQLDRKHGK